MITFIKQARAIQKEKYRKIYLEFYEQVCDWVESDEAYI